MYTNEQGSSQTNTEVGAQIDQGHGYSATSGYVNVAAASNIAMYLLNPVASSKMVKLYGIQFGSDIDGKGGVIAAVTGEPAIAGTWTSISAINKHRTSPTSALAVAKYTSNFGAQPANITDTFITQGKAFIQVLRELGETKLPPGTGIVVWIPLAGAGNAYVNFDWVEMG